MLNMFKSGDDRHIWPIRILIRESIFSNQVAVIDANCLLRQSSIIVTGFIKFLKNSIYVSDLHPNKYNLKCFLWQQSYTGTPAGVTFQVR